MKGHGYQLPNPNFQIPNSNAECWEERARCHGIYFAGDDEYFAAPRHIPQPCRRCRALQVGRATSGDPGRTAGFLRQITVRDGDMSRILVLYGTTEGQTGKIAHALADALRAAGVSADVADAGADWPDARRYDAVIVAASIHAGGYQRAVRRWVRAHAGVLNEKPTAFVSVCLAILQREARVHQELSAIVDRFVRSTGWRPSTTKHVAGALAYSRYNWFTRLAMVRIVRKAGGDTDTSRDYEYTDWADVRAFAAGFARSVTARPISPDVGQAPRKVA